MRPARRHFINLLTGAALLLPLSLVAAPKTSRKKPAPKKERVVLQISDSDSKRWNLVLNTAKTLQTEYGEDKIDVAIVAIGPGINMLKDDSDVANRVQTAIERKIFFMSCESSMKALNVEEKSLSRHVFVVPSGAAELIKRQRDGWVYLRP